MMFLEIISVVFTISVILFLGIYLFQRRRNAKIKQDVLLLLNEKGQVSFEHGKHFFHFNNNTYELLFFYVPLFADLTINSKTIWEIKDSSKTRLFNQSHFLSSPYKKLIIVFPSQVAIKRYINENELVFVKYNQMFNQMFIVRTFELPILLEEDIL
jgi:hypothetical protein